MKKKRPSQNDSSPMTVKGSGVFNMWAEYKKVILAGATIVVLVIALFRLTAPVPISNDPSATGLGLQLYEERPLAPDFTLRRMNGTDLRLSDLRGKVVFVNFFATWCAPCKWEMPEMESLYLSFKGENFEMVAISIDSTRNPIKPFVDSMNLTFPIVHDGSQQVARSYGFRGPPLSFLIDRKGRIVGGASGPRKWNGPDAKNLLRKLMAEPAV
jgi:peroxiredoxin